MVRSSLGGKKKNAVTSCFYKKVWLRKKETWAALQALRPANQYPVPLDLLFYRGEFSDWQFSELNSTTRLK